MRPNWRVQRWRTTCQASKTTVDHETNPASAKKETDLRRDQLGDCKLGAPNLLSQADFLGEKVGIHTVLLRDKSPFRDPSPFSLERGGRI